MTSSAEQDRIDINSRPRTANDQPNLNQPLFQGLRHGAAADVKVRRSNSKIGRPYISMTRNQAAMSETILPHTRSRVLDLLAERVRAHLGDRLEALYALSDDPYEPESNPEALHVVAVLQDEGYEWNQAQHELNRVGVAFDRSLNYAYVAVINVASVSEVERGATGAARAVREGVLL